MWRAEHLAEFSLIIFLKTYNRLFLVIVRLSCDWRDLAWSLEWRVAQTWTWAWQWRSSQSLPPPPPGWCGPRWSPPPAPDPELAGRGSRSPARFPGSCWGRAWRPPPILPGLAPGSWSQSDQPQNLIHEDDCLITWKDSQAVLALNSRGLQYVFANNEYRNLQIVFKNCFTTCFYRLFYRRASGNNISYK